MMAGKRATGISAMTGVRVVMAALGCFASATALAQTPAQVPVQTPAQGPAPVRMEFDAVIRQAIDKNPTIARAATNISRAETLLQEARALTLPLLTANVTNATLDSARNLRIAAVCGGREKFQ